MIFRSVLFLILSFASLQAAETAIFAGGCFWCVEHDFDQVPGVLSTTSGYTGGTEAKPSYGEVSSGTTGHAESVLIKYDPNVVSYEELIDVFWRNIDPTHNDRQFCDFGRQYRPAIFYLNDEQRKLAEASREKILKTTKIRPILVEISSAGEFYPAEEYHQNYAEKNPWRYKFYRRRCGRDRRLQELWGK